MTAKMLNAKISHWMSSDDVDNLVSVGKRVFRLEYNGDIYRIYENDKCIGWNDNHKDFRNIGFWLFDNKSVI